MKQEVQENIEVLTKAFYNQLAAIMEECTGLEKASNKATVYVFNDKKAVLDVGIAFENIEDYEKGITAGLYPDDLEKEMEA